MPRDGRDGRGRGGPEVFPHDVDVPFNAAYATFLRTSDGLDLARDVTKRLTVVASLLLLPTFIVGIYGQNFRDIPELHWRFGYG